MTVEQVQEAQNEIILLLTEDVIQFVFGHLEKVT
jgi:hypothetical protein